MSYNVYEVGDCVYLETASSDPYSIAKIEYFEKTREGNLIANVRSFFRRRDLPDNLIALADGHVPDLEEDNGRNRLALNGIQLHQLKHRELFLSEKTEKLFANQIRGKCQVHLFIDVEGFFTYLERDDVFFYCLVYDYVGKHFITQRKQVRIGPKYQADIPTLHEITGECGIQAETQIWNPDRISNIQIDQFLMLCRCAGTFARGVDPIRAENCPHLLKTIASASRDVTCFRAMDILHECDYNVAVAINLLVPSCRPLLCKDQMEDWSVAEAQMFENALAIHDKDFNSIRENVLPWKTLKNIIEYYYMWKASDRHLMHVQEKVLAGEYKVKKVCIPFDVPHAQNDGKKVLNGAKTWQGSIGRNVMCMSCNTLFSGQCFGWGPEQRKVCASCWLYWKKYGGLKKPLDLTENRGPYTVQRFHRCRFQACLLQFKSKLDLARHYTRDHGANLKLLMSSQNKKKKLSFYFRPTPLTRISRYFCLNTFRPRVAARSPCKPLNITLIRQECNQRMAGHSVSELRNLATRRLRRCSITEITDGLRLSNSPTNISYPV